MTLLSDSLMNMFPSNIQSEFTVKLDHPIEIDEETWEVALAEIATPSEVLNITEDNFFFLAFPDQHILYTKFGVENITEMCSNENGDCYKFKLKIPTGNYMSPKYLVEEMQASIDKFEKGILKHLNAYISINYKSTFESVSSKRKTGQDCVSKSICSYFRFRPNNDWKTYWKRRKYVQIQCQFAS